MDTLVIFLHGSGDTGPGVREWVNQYAFEKRLASIGVSVQFPTATPRPYSLWGGEIGTVWMNRLGLNPDAEEETTSIKDSMGKIDGIIDTALKEKLVASPSKVFVGGFSQGGCLALYIGLSGKYKGQLGGIFCCSGFLPNTSFALTNITNPSQHDESDLRASKQPVLMLHGDADEMVSCQWGEDTAKRIADLGMKVSFEKVRNLEHQLNGYVIDQVINLIKSQTS